MLEVEQRKSHCRPRSGYNKNDAYNEVIAHKAQNTHRVTSE